ncbi:MAG: Ig-like domain-containing protein [Octadecabacter sp.]
MSAINFVVRDVAGNISRGTVAGEGVSSSLIVGAGADVSLNLTQGQIISYTRQGQALEITLIDGRVIVVEGYFTSEGVAENQLFLSADGYLTEVDLTQGAGADYYANYLQMDSAGKFAVNDDLYFMRGADVLLADSFEPADDQVGMLAAMAPLIGWGGGAAAAAAGAAVLAGSGGGGGGGGGGPTAPEVAVTSGTKEGDSHVVNEEEHADGVEIGGTGTPGATVDVTIDDVTETTTVADDGTWEVTFDPSDVETGEYSTDVDVTVTNEGGSTSVTHTLVVDTVIGADISATGGADGVINATEFDGGVTLSGTVTGGDTVVITIDGTEYAAEVSGSTWTLAAGAAITAGDYHTHDIIITTTDAAGNSSSTTGTVVVDTVTTATISTAGSGGTDGVIFTDEHPNGVSLTGTAEAGSTVVLTLSDANQTYATHTFEADDSGTWAYTFPASEVPTGELTLVAAIEATDLAGNTSRDEGSVVIDTFVNELEMTTNTSGGDDGVVNFNESSQSITMAGTVEVGSTVSVNLHGVIMDATVDAATGDWTVTYPGGSLPGGEYSTTVVITATDAAGNSSSLTEAVQVDTVVGDLALSTQPIEFDDVVNYDEASNGVVINGTATPGLVVTVGFGDATMDVLAQPNGTWSANFPANQVPADTRSAQITASITDAAGNFKEVSDTVEIDTVVSPFNFSAGQIEGNDIINFNEAKDGGVTFDGQVEAFSSVLVEFNGHSQTVNANGAGQWTANFTQAQIGSDEYTAVVKATATDPHDNISQPITRTVEVDTLVTHLTTADPVEGDNVVNFAEAVDGVTLTGTVEAGSTVLITYDHNGGQIVREATVDSSGNWSITYAGSEIPQGEYDVNITIDSTDANGNTLSMTDEFRVDTEVAIAPTGIGTFVENDAIGSLRVNATDGDLSVSEISSRGSVNEIATQEDAIDLGSSVLFDFDPTVPDGSHLVVTDTDDAGNTNSTYVVLDESGTNAVDLSNLDGFNIGAIDLGVSTDSELTIDLSTLAGLSDNDNNLVIHGGSDDAVDLTGATSTGQSETIDGKSFDVYTMGDDAQIFIEDGVNVTI